MNGRELAEKILSDNNVSVEIAVGESDYYNVGQKKIFLTAGVFYLENPYSLAIAAHEAAHAIQHKNGSWALLLKAILGWSIFTLKVESDATDIALKYLKPLLPTVEYGLAERVLADCLFTYKK